ncbi:hypothetical protein Mmc1_3666 [Magnetococcus marinus MC-1]|uniref:Uncharacterized protein n=1 Tax=Magnetococcus marinus (strain ATCC BAA-1437 / JCM 17883 / MC-1) TaxID=156889 RepID=A0LDV8_MAGMM|nr:hypothetical protein [Magnetococcus marinus]ABK46151.1 hypothetical protein Mmc1_3666 [Magnetococcus marinus MC-1]
MMKRLVGLPLAMVLLLASGTAQAVYRKGCEVPLKDVQVCWEASTNNDGKITPFPEVHLLPITQKQAGQDGVLVDYTRTIYRQILPGRIAERLVQEWQPAYHLEEAVMLAQDNDWPVTLWIEPRILRNSGTATSGLVDWDAYLLGEKGELLRRMRIRVDSEPHQRKHDAEMATGMSAALINTGMFVKNPALALTAISTSTSMAKSSPPEAGYSLELMTELATRQVLFLTQNALEDLSAPPRPEEPNLFKTLFFHDQPPPNAPTASDPMPARASTMDHVKGWWQRNVVPAAQPRP